MLATTLLTILTTSLSLIYAQVLTNGNSRFPSCASTCTLLNQAAQACGGTANADQTVWECFCQSAYLKSLYTSPDGICNAFCPNANDNQQVMTWYKSNCGQDNGASEHAGAGTAQSLSSVAGGAGTPAATSSGVPASASTSSTAGVGAGDVTNPDPTETGGWWHNHWRWVIMIIVIAAGLLLLTLIALYLKRRHNRKRDKIDRPFNAGITERTTPMTHANSPGGNDSSIMAAGALEPTSGRDSPVRTREAFMPYGYGYTRSESRLASPVNGRASPLARGGTPVDELEKDVSMGSQVTETPSTGPKKLRRIPVRERSMKGTGTDEKGKDMAS